MVIILGVVRSEYGKGLRVRGARVVRTLGGLDVRGFFGGGAA